MGLQIGNRNVQENEFHYSFDGGKVDLSRALERPEVRYALSNLATSPSDTHLQDAADRALRATPFLGFPRDKIGARTVKETHDTSSTRGLFAGTIEIRDCSGVQVGSNQTQTNYYAHVVTGAPDGRRLLAESPELRAELINHFVRADGVGGSLASALNGALEEAVMASGRLQTEGTLISTVGRRSISVQDDSAVSIGGGNRMIDNVVVTVTAPAQTVGQLQDYQAGLPGIVPYGPAIPEVGALGPDLRAEGAVYSWITLGATHEDDE